MQIIFPMYNINLSCLANTLYSIDYFNYLHNIQGHLYVHNINVYIDTEKYTAREQQNIIVAQLYMYMYLQGMCKENEISLQ